LSFSKIIVPVEKVSVAIDPDDNKVLEAALEANADFIVSGDKHLLNLKEFKGVRILTAKEFLDKFFPSRQCF
jgi:predicted nucleic acid-binding protein